MLVSVNGVSLETVDAKKARELIGGASRPVTLVFRDPAAFLEGES